MTIRNLDALFHPKSIAVIGASSRPDSLGATVFANVMGGGFAGAIYPVNPKHKTIHGLTVHPDITVLPAVPSLALICTPQRLHRSATAARCLLCMLLAPPHRPARSPMR